MISDEMLDSTTIPEVRAHDPPRDLRGLSPDTVAVVALAVLLFGTVAFRWYYDNWLAELDIFTAFLPSFSYVGSRLREFEIPAWNPYSSSGTPMTGDSQSGWMYLPVMISFSLFNPSNGIKVMVLIQTLIGGVSAYFLARRIGLGALPAFLAALSFGIGPLIYAGTIAITVASQLNAFFPLVLLGVESALRADRLSARLGWSAAAAIAFSQVFYAWAGQGSLYAAAIVGGWMAWRLSPRLDRFVSTCSDWWFRALPSWWR